MGGRGRRRSPSAKGRSSGFRWKLLPAIGATALITAGAIITPLGQRLIDWVVPATKQRDSLSVNTMWPGVRECDVTEVALLSATSDPQTVQLNHAAKPQEQLLKSGGIAWGSAYLYINLSTKGDTVAQIISFRPEVFRTGIVVPKWVFKPQGGGCGDEYSRTFALDLNRTRLVDVGIQPSPDPAQLNAGPRPKVAPLGPAFTVSRTDPAQLTVIVDGCSKYFEWGLHVTYIIDGEQRVLDIGSPKSPLRLLGATTGPIEVFGNDPYHRSPGLLPLGSIKSTYWCKFGKHSWDS